MALAALQSYHVFVEAVQIIDEDLFNQVAKQAHSSRRKRVNYNFHASAEENSRRFLNVLLRGTYIRPHRHLEPPKSDKQFAAWAPKEDDAGAQLYLESLTNC